MAKDEGFQPPTQGPIFGEGDVDQRGQFVADPADELEVPEGNIEAVQSWMGTDKTRAKAVLKAEGEDGRKSLIALAQSVLGGETGAGLASGEV
jgi:capsule polysaccharide export protein KpsE/RkpR